MDFKGADEFQYMNKDLFLYLLYFIPLFWAVVIDQEKLRYRNVFFKHLFISLLLLSFGALPELYEDKEPKSLSYFGSQMLFTFLMLYKIIRTIYVRIYQEEPEFSETAEKFRDKIATGILYIGMISVPFLIDEYIVQKFV